jgi:isoleucyl-tRNA synthetase
MASGYNPIAIESAWYDWWEAQGFFKPQITEDGKTKEEGVFVVPMPPPNVTGSLHIGHALTIAIQDCLIRWYIQSALGHFIAVLTVSIGIGCLERVPSSSQVLTMLESPRSP